MPMLRKVPAPTGAGAFAVRSVEPSGEAMTAPADTTAPPAEVQAPQDVADEIPVRFPVLLVEGMRTSDGRYIEPGTVEHRALPLPVLAQVRNPDGGKGHDGAWVVGRVDNLERLPGPEVMSKETGEPFPEGVFVWAGDGVLDANHPATDLVRRRYLTGNSADLSDVTADLVYAEDDPNRVEQVNLSGGKIAATTLVPVPAFADAYIEVGGEQLTPAEDQPVTAAVPAWRVGELGDDCMLCAAEDDGELEEFIARTPSGAVSTKAREKARAKRHTMPDGSFPIENAEDARNAIQSVGRAKEPEAARRHIIRRLRALGLERMIPKQWLGSEKAQAAAEPPPEWFADPQLGGPTPLTVTDDGRVFGHLATWGSCHIGFTGRCVTPPRSPSAYAYFRTGLVRCADGSEVPVGHITMDTGHASTTLGQAAAASHYDNTGAAVADVAAGEDDHGIWVAGAVRPGVEPERLSRLRAASLSGDWRPIKGELDLVAALAVNVPGYPVPRARVASGEVVALVAAGALPADPLTAALAGRVAELEIRLAALEAGPLLAALDDTEEVFAELVDDLDDGEPLDDPAVIEFVDAEFARLAQIVPRVYTTDDFLALLDLDPEDVALFKRQNWVSQTGGLPKYVKRISRHLRRKGMTESHAIATAVNVVKKMCANLGDRLNFPGSQRKVNPGSIAQACAAFADWMRKRAQARATPNK